MKTQEKMNLTEHYNNLYKSSMRNIESDNYQIDSLIDSGNDSRFGITLLIRPSAEVKDQIQSFLQKLKTIDSLQYYYPNSDIHITVLSIISCSEGFDINQIALPNYIDLIRKSIKKFDKFNICCQGITASGSSIMIQGFPENQSLDKLRNSLRKNFKSSGLQQSIDKRYTLQTAHSTVVRFRNELQMKGEFLKMIELYRNHDFGCFEVDEIELVYNDWYQRKDNTRLLKKFVL